MLAKLGGSAGTVGIGRNGSLCDTGGGLSLLVILAQLEI